MYDTVYVLGTWDTQRSYTLTKGFELDPSGDGLWHITGPNRLIETKADLPVRMLQNGSYVGATLAPGTKLRVTETDEVSFIQFTLTDGRQGIIEFTLEDYVAMIDGIPDDQWFVELFYVG